jgi:hypothetical protein
MKPAGEGLGPHAVWREGGDDHSHLLGKHKDDREGEQGGRDGEQDGQERTRRKQADERHDRSLGHARQTERKRVTSDQIQDPSETCEQVKQVIQREHL